MRSASLFLSLLLLAACDSGGGTTTGPDVGRSPDTVTVADTVALPDTVPTPDTATVPDTATTPDTATVPDTEAGSDTATVRDAVSDAIVLPDAEAVPDTGPGPDVAVDEDVPACPTPEALVEPAVAGLVYEDGDESSLSFYAQTMQEPSDGPLEGVVVELFGEEGLWETESCPSGRFSFGEVAEGVYLLGVQADEGRLSTSHNLARRVPEAIREGSLTIVTFGDSIPVYGGTPYFPEVLEGLLDPLVAIDNRVVARPGSTSSEWVPGSTYFTQRLEPNLADADLVIGSIGGNDLSEFFDVYSTDFDREELVAKLGGFPDFLDEVTGRIVSTLEEIRAQAPQADVVYITYCNYARSERWQLLSGEYAGIAEYGLDNALRIMRQTISQVDGVLIADMFAATAGEALEPYLSDEIHLSTAGAARWAREIFLLLGGVIVGDGEIGLERSYGLSPLE